MIPRGEGCLLSQLVGRNSKLDLKKKKKPSNDQFKTKNSLVKYLIYKDTNIL